MGGGGLYWLIPVLTVVVIVILAWGIFAKRRSRGDR
jgi:cytochrome c-type biogenesis protein CcmH/NrfF